MEVNVNCIQLVKDDNEHPHRDRIASRKLEIHPRLPI